MYHGQLTPQQINEIHERFETNCKLLGYTPQNRLLSNIEAAAICGFQPNSFEQKRLYLTGPPCIQIQGSRRILYSEPVLLDWIVSGFHALTGAA